MTKELDEKALLDLSPDDEGNAQAVRLLYGEKILYTPAYGWMWYDGKCWQTKLAEAKINRAIIETLKIRGQLAFQNASEENPRRKLIAASQLSAQRKNNARAQLQDILTTNEALFDANPDLLNVANGVLDLRTGELIPHTPDYRFTYILDTPYEPDAKSPQWTRFLSETIGHDVIDFLQSAVGYSLTGHTSEELLFYVHGPTRSGKGTFTETLLLLLGVPISTEADFETFSAKRDGDTQNFDLAPLKPCRFVAASESQRYHRLNSSKIKTLTGGNLIRCAFKHRDHFAYRPQFKIWLSSNFQINIDPDDDAAWARVRVVNFPNSFLGREDKQLKQALRRPESLKAVLAWAVAGSQRWYSTKQGLKPPKAVIQATVEAREALDYISQFIEEHYELVADEAITESDKAWLPSSEVYRRYKEWAEAEGYQPKYQGGFTQSLKARGFRAGRKRIAGALTRCVVGIKEL